MHFHSSLCYCSYVKNLYSIANSKLHVKCTMLSVVSSSTKGVVQFQVFLKASTLIDIEARRLFHPITQRSTRSGRLILMLTMTQKPIESCRLFDLYPPKTYIAWDIVSLMFYNDSKPWSVIKLWQWQQAVPAYLTAAKLLLPVHGCCLIRS